MGRQPLLFVSLIAILQLALAGCGSSIPERNNVPDLGTVHGKVTLDGRPMSGLMIVLTPDDESKPSFSNTDEEGNYKAMYFVDLEGVKVGPCTISVNGGLGNSVKVPSRYSSKSELKLDVQPGDNEFNIEMKSK